MTAWQTDWITEWLTDWLIDWLSDWSSASAQVLAKRERERESVCVWKREAERRGRNVTIPIENTSINLSLSPMYHPRTPWLFENILTKSTENWNSCTVHNNITTVKVSQDANPAFQTPAHSNQNPKPETQTQKQTETQTQENESNCNRYGRIELVPSH